MDMFKKFTFRGEMAPVFTPFKDECNLTIDYELIPKYADILSNKGVRGVLVNGTSGEGMSMSVSERKTILETWIKACNQNNQTVMVQVGGAPLPDVVALAKHAEETKADAILCLPELYIKPKNTTELIKYLSHVAKAAPNTPLLYYHIPMFTNVNIYMPEFLKEANTKLKTLVGIKFTSTDLAEGTECLNVCDGKYAIFLGADQLLAPAYLNGFDSTIATTLNIWPELILSIRKTLKESKSITEVQKLQRELTQNVNNIVKHGSWVASMKAAMNINGPIDFGGVRPPFENLTVSQKQQIKEEIFFKE